MYIYTNKTGYIGVKLMYIYVYMYSVYYMYVNGLQEKEMFMVNTIW